MDPTQSELEKKSVEKADMARGSNLGGPRAKIDRFDHCARVVIRCETQKRSSYTRPAGDAPLPPRRTSRWGPEHAPPPFCCFIQLSPHLKPDRGTQTQPRFFYALHTRKLRAQRAVVDNIVGRGHGALRRLFLRHIDGQPIAVPSESARVVALDSIGHTTQKSWEPFRACASTEIEQ